MKLYSVKDKKGDFGVTVTFSNDDAAKRALPFLADNNPLMQRYPEDFSLYRVGEFDFLSGVIVPESAPVFLCNFPVKEVEKDA